MVKTKEGVSVGCEYIKMTNWEKEHQVYKSDMPMLLPCRLVGKSATHRMYVMTPMDHMSQDRS